MTRLIDLHAPRHDVTQTLVLTVHAAPADLLRAIELCDLGGDAFAGVRSLGRARDERVFAIRWRPRPGTPGHVDVVWDVRVEAGEDDVSYLCSTRRFIASDAGTREDLRACWRNVGSVADAVARRTARRIKRTAEERPALEPAPRMDVVALAA